MSISRVCHVILDLYFDFRCLTKLPVMSMRKSTLSHGYRRLSTPSGQHASRKEWMCWSHQWCTTIVHRKVMVRWIDDISYYIKGVYHRQRFDVLPLMRLSPDKASRHDDNSTSEDTAQSQANDATGCYELKSSSVLDETGLYLSHFLAWSGIYCVFGLLILWLYCVRSSKKYHLVLIVITSPF